MPHRYFATDRTYLQVKPTVIFETDADKTLELSNHIIWKVDPSLFPIKEDHEILDYFKELTDSPENTFILPGFDTIRTT